MPPDLEFPKHWTLIQNLGEVRTWLSTAWNRHHQDSLEQPQPGATVFRHSPSSPSLRVCELSRCAQGRWFAFSLLVCSRLRKNKRGEGAREKQRVRGPEHNREKQRKNQRQFIAFGPGEPTVDWQRAGQEACDTVSPFVTAVDANCYLIAVRSD